MTREDHQVLTYLVTVRTFGRRSQVKAGVGRRIAALLALNFNDADVRFVSKVDVPRTKPHEPTEIPSSPLSGD